MRLKLHINETPREIERLMLEALSKDLNIHLAQKWPAVLSFFKQEIEIIIFNDFTSGELSFGSLKADFGLNFDPVPAIAKAVADSVIVNFVPLNKKLQGGYTIKVQPLDYLNLLSLPESFVITEKGVQLPWLDWLLTYGDSIIIVDFGVLYKSGAGRSNMAIMVQGNRPFSVNPQHSGTVDDNWITRAIDNNLSSLESGLAAILS